MEFDFDDPLDEPATEDETDRLGIAALAIDIIRRPASAMRRLAAHPDRRWLAPLAALIVMSVVATVTSFPGRTAFSREAMRQSLEAAEASGAAVGPAEDVAEIATTATQIFSLIGAVVAPIIAVLLIAAVLHFLGTMLGGQQNYTQMFTAINWARVPLIFQAGARTIYLLAGGHYDPYPSGLEGLVGPNQLLGETVPSFWQPPAAELAVWNFWMLALCVIAVREVSKVSLRKALIAVGAYVALLLLLGELGVVIGRFLADFAEGFS
jgi:hypothetical protein